MATGVGTRAVQLIGTLVLTRFITPADYGEVSAAAICVLSAKQLTSFAFGQYVIANRSPADVAFQATGINLGLTFLAMVGVFVLRGPLGIMLDAPGMGRFIAGFALAYLLDSARLVQAALLVRELRFRVVAIVNSVGEVTFTATALALAPRWGGYSIMMGSLIRSTITFILFIAIAPREEWLKRAPFRMKVARSLFGYGAPLMLSSLADRAASTWDNLIVLRLFGARVMGSYALSYSLAETPLIYVAERMSDVLMPAFSKMDPGERPAAVVRAGGLMALVVAPLGVGLGAVAPTIVTLFFDAKWAGMASILTMLSVMTVFQPAPWSAGAYLAAENKTKLIMTMSIARAILILSLVAVLGWVGGPVWACAGVGAGYAAHSVLLVILAARYTPLPARAYFVSIVRPLLACIPMFVGVYLIRVFLAGKHVPGALSLAAQIIGGAAAYVGGALLFARANVRELLRLMRSGPSAGESTS